MLMKMRSKMQNQKGFTLVELMVVVVILGILVAIAVPIYQNVSENAKQKAHDANVRILTGAGEAYYASVDGTVAEDVVWDAIDDGDAQKYLNEWPTNPFGGSYTVTIKTNGTVTVDPPAKDYTSGS